MASNNQTPGTLTNINGCPVNHNKNSLTAGPFGPGLMQDTYLIEKVKQFAREKTPPRNVHAVGHGAYGTFTCTNPEIRKYSMASVFNGQTFPLIARLSGTFTELGEADTTRDIRGFAFKIKGEDGNWDLLSVNTPVFNCRDMKIGPDVVHSLKRDPRTGLYNDNTWWDFAGHHPESLHQTLMLFTDKVGTPLSFRTQHYWAANTFSLINDKKQRFWVRFHLVSQQGHEGMTQLEARLIAGQDSNFLQRDLQESIERGEFPKWKMAVQIMSEEQGYKIPVTFDCTKVWNQDDFPLIEVGIIELNKNVTDHFTEVESVAFSPARVPPGISFSPDKLLQGRLLVYDDTQHHRLGPNYQMLPINCPFAKINSNYYNGGNMNAQIKSKFPNYYPSVFTSNLPITNPTFLEPPLRCDGPGDFYNLPTEGSDMDYYEQPREFLKKLEEKEFKNMCYNIVTSLEKTVPEIQTIILIHFNKISGNLYGQVLSIMEARKVNAGKTESEILLANMESKLKNLKHTS